MVSIIFERIVECYLRKLTSSKALVWSILLFRHRAAAILFLSLRICLLSSSSGDMPIVLLGLLPPIFLLVCCWGWFWLWWFSMLLWWIVFWVWAGVGCDGSTRGGTNPASLLWEADSLVSSRKVCSILRRVVGVSVGVVLVGTPLCSPSKDISWSNKNKIFSLVYF